MNASSFTNILVGVPRVLILLCLILSVSMGSAQRTGTTTSYFWKQCDEEVLLVDVDPEKIRPLIPAEYTLALNDGKVLILIVVQDCLGYWFNGEEIGTTQEVHHWVRLEGPEDVRAVPGAESTLPTMSWYQVFVGSSNPSVRSFWTRSGSDGQQLERLSFSLTGDRRTGEVRVSGDKTYNWSARTKDPWARMVGVNHDLYRQTSDGKPIFHRIQCLLTVDAWDSPGTLDVTGGSDTHNLLSQGSYSMELHSFRPLWCHGTLNEPEQ